MQQTGMLRELYSKNYALNLESGKQRDDEVSKISDLATLFKNQVKLETCTYLQEQSRTILHVTLVFHDIRTAEKLLLQLLHSPNQV